MWKIMNRVRHLFVKSVKNSRITSPSEENKTAHLQQSAPAILKIVNCLNCNNNSTKRNNRDYRANNNDYTRQIHNEWLEAFGWSGVIFLSWVLCFPCNRHKISSNPAERYAYSCLNGLPSKEYCPLVKCISSFILQPSAKYVLPTVSAVRPKSATHNKTEENEVLRETCENLEAAHEKVLSSLNNWLGTESMQAGRQDEAFHYFSIAADANSAAGLFNLGICYELGIGTAQNFSKAATLYKKASEQGHATAMYNLGVFHVHGWGGLEVNVAEARELFTQAARLGQTEARKALHWNEDSKNADSSPSPDEPISNSQQYQHFREIIEPKSNDMTGLWLNVLNIRLNDLNLHNESQKNTSEVGLESIDSGINVSPTGSLMYRQW